jgi:hypothetical protein
MGVRLTSTVALRPALVPESQPQQRKRIFYIVRMAALWISEVYRATRLHLLVSLSFLPFYVPRQVITPQSFGGLHKGCFNVTSDLLVD